LAKIKGIQRGFVMALSAVAASRKKRRQAGIFLADRIQKKKNPST
jgi:hypothetical protein